jgi:hypothetical protein
MMQKEGERLKRRRLKLWLLKLLPEKNPKQVAALLEKIKNGAERC